MKLTAARRPGSVLRVSKHAAPIRLLALGGTTRTGSSSERALRLAGAAAESAGAEVEYRVGADLVLPIYAPETADRTPEAAGLVEAARHADGLLIASPGYHGGMSGMVKNALDYIEDLREHDRVYLDGLPVGLIAVANGWQAAVTTLENLRTVIHALRGWPTPLGVSLNSAAASDGPDPIESARTQLELLVAQVIGFAGASPAIAGM